ncbi:hypothetical protein [Lactococcus garvieae]|uniref:DUF3990 domain-containing protein n=1 Tax=Lactococcus garvieae TaxID=1363 RepID=A0AA46YVH1_9LACT|nr:hypothetical protein [Lactococcus garvieae]UYT11293.1 hypothetical protein OF801_04920 [Lactococcus garvieae]UYT13234.1 hypothetical protein OF800_04395 [Lactococcus garvieae]
MKKYDCYHGTGLKNYQNIVECGTFTFKPRENHWLGGGVYFFIDDVAKAKWWAKSNRPDKETPPLVLKVNLEFELDELLNLDSEEDLKKLDEYAEDILASLNANKAQLKDVDEHVWQCKLLEAFLSKNTIYSGICRTFETTQEKGASGFQGLAKQLCVRDVGKIPISSIEQIAV